MRSAWFIPLVAGLWVVHLLHYQSQQEVEEMTHHASSMGDPLIDVHMLLKDDYNSNPVTVCVEFYEENEKIREREIRSSSLIIPKVSWRRYDTLTSIGNNGVKTLYITDNHFFTEKRLIYSKDGDLTEKREYVKSNYHPIGQWEFYTAGLLDSLIDYEHDLGITFHQAFAIAKKYGKLNRYTEFSLEYRDHLQYWVVALWPEDNDDEVEAEVVLIQTDNGKVTVNKEIRFRITSGQFDGWIE